MSLDGIEVVRWGWDRHPLARHLGDWTLALARPLERLELNPRAYTLACCYCRRVRRLDEWVSVEVPPERASHGVCPDDVWRLDAQIVSRRRPAA